MTADATSAMNRAGNAADRAAAKTEAAGDKAANAASDAATTAKVKSRLMAERMRGAGKQGRLVTYEKLDHYLEDSTARRDMLSQSATFLEQSFAAGK